MTLARELFVGKQRDVQVSKSRKLDLNSFSATLFTGKPAYWISGILGSSKRVASLQKPVPGLGEVHTSQLLNFTSYLLVTSNTWISQVSSHCRDNQDFEKLR